MHEEIEGFEKELAGFTSNQEAESYKWKSEMDELTLRLKTEEMKSCNLKIMQDKT
jgi:hypothetical protein